MGAYNKKNKPKHTTKLKYVVCPWNGPVGYSLNSKRHPRDFAAYYSFNKTSIGGR